MIDIFPQIYAGIKAKLGLYRRSTEGTALLGTRNIEFHNAYTRVEQHFPSVTVEEKRNAISEDEMDLVEKRAELVYDVNVYDNGKNRTEVCRKIASVIDEYMAKEMGFQRTVGEPFPNVGDSTIYRYLLRYEGYCDTETGNITKTK